MSTQKDIKLISGYTIDDAASFIAKRAMLGVPQTSFIKLSFIKNAAPDATSAASALVGAMNPLGAANVANAAMPYQPTWYENLLGRENVNSAQNYLQQAWDNPYIRNSLIGAGVGGAAGLGSSLLGKKKRHLSSLLAGAALGGGLGAGYTWMFPPAGPAEPPKPPADSSAAIANAKNQAANANFNAARDALKESPGEIGKEKATGYMQQGNQNLRESDAAKNQEAAIQTPVGTLGIAPRKVTEPETLPELDKDKQTALSQAPTTGNDEDWLARATTVPFRMGRDVLRHYAGGPGGQNELGKTLRLAPAVTDNQAERPNYLTNPANIASQIGNLGRGIGFGGLPAASLVAANLGDASRKVDANLNMGPIPTSEGGRLQLPSAATPTITPGFQDWIEGKNNSGNREGLQFMAGAAGLRSTADFLRGAGVGWNRTNYKMLKPFTALGQGVASTVGGYMPTQGLQAAVGGRGSKPIYDMWNMARRSPKPDKLMPQAKALREAIDKAGRGGGTGTANYFPFSKTMARGGTYANTQEALAEQLANKSLFRSGFDALKGPGIMAAAYGLGQFAGHQRDATHLEQLGKAVLPPLASGWNKTKDLARAAYDKVPLPWTRPSDYEQLEELPGATLADRGLNIPGMIGPHSPILPGGNKPIAGASSAKGPYPASDFTGDAFKRQNAPLPIPDIFSKPGPLLPGMPAGESKKGRPYTP